MAKRRKIEMTVVFSVEVDEDVDCEELCLDVDSDLITIGSIHREQVGAKILGYGTTHVEEV